MMFCARDGAGPARVGKKMRWGDVADIVLTALFSPVVYVFVTRAPVLTSIVFSSLLVSG
jgi:hypothetical protein